LVLTLGALFSNASVALNSSASPSADYDLASLGSSVKPTIIVATSTTMSAAHARKMGEIKGFASFKHSGARRTLLAGAMRKGNAVAGGMRLLYTFDTAGSEHPPLSPTELSDLRIVTGARIIYALTTPKVAGALTQTHMLDYRVASGKGRSHVGAPVSCLEVKMVDSARWKVSDEDVAGEVVVSGPAVSGGVEVKTGVEMRAKDDGTFEVL
jgi:hypothetical protein